METKQTAVDYIVNVVNSCIAPDYIPNEIVMQAKQMEKEQIEEAYDNGGEHYTEYGKAILGKDYYNETYGKENSN